MVVLNYIAFILLAVGGINWGLVGIFNWNIIDYIFGEKSITSRVIYTIVFLCALWLFISILVTGGYIYFR